MANEFLHTAVGAVLTQAEFELADGNSHSFNAQATGDLLYASSATVLRRLAIGDGLLQGNSGVPVWATTITSPLTFAGNPTLNASTPSILFRTAGLDSEDFQQDASSNLNLVNNTSGYGTLVRVTRLGNLTLGAAAVGTSGGRVLGIGNGVEPSTSPADLVQLYSVDIAGGDATLGIRTEKAVVTPAGDFALTSKLIVRVNGVTYAIGMTTVLT